MAHLLDDVGAADAGTRRVNGLIVIPLVFAIAALTVAAYLIGTIDLDMVLARWEQDRTDREAIRAEQAKREALRSSFPRVMKP